MNPSINMEPIIELKDFIIERETPILRGINWRVLPGEHWVILGANGSGKTSLISSISGFMAFTDGSMRVLGRVYGEDDWSELKKHIGFVSSTLEQRIDPDEVGLDTIISGLYTMINFWGKATNEDKRKAQKILADVECEHLAGRAWGVMSQGERKRILIGRALVSHPGLLILDEPCAGLDPMARETFLTFLTRIAKKSHAPSMVFVTHHLEEIVPVFSRVMILKGGKILAQGETSQVLTSFNLAEAFDAPVRLSFEGGRYSMAVHSNSNLTI